MTRTATLVASAFALCVFTATAAVRSQGTSTADGIYTADQAAAGKDLYGKVCETCHQAEKFAGAEFTRAFGGKPLSEIDAAMAEMPADNPNSLARDDIAALIAYFLSMNSYPTGLTPLSGEAETLKRITVSPRP